MAFLFETFEHSLRDQDQIFGWINVSLKMNPSFNPFLLGFLCVARVAFPQDYRRYLETESISATFQTIDSLKLKNNSARGKVPNKQRVGSSIISAIFGQESMATALHKREHMDDDFSFRMWEHSKSIEPTSIREVLNYLKKFGHLCG